VFTLQYLVFITRSEYKVFRIINLHDHRVYSRLHPAIFLIIFQASKFEFFYGSKKSSSELMSQNDALRCCICLSGSPVECLKRGLGQLWGFKKKKHARQYLEISIACFCPTCLQILFGVSRSSWCPQIHLRWTKKLTCHHHFSLRLKISIADLFVERLIWGSRLDKRPP
jgi:hypothetical protein